MKYTKGPLDDLTTVYDDELYEQEAKERLVAPPDWNGPIQRRHCTDLPCLTLLLASWIVMTCVGYMAIQEGDYRVIVYPMDYDGNICGMHFTSGGDGGGQDMTEYPFLWYVNSYTGGVCVKECPSLKGLVEDDLTDIRTLITYNGLWQTEDGLAELQNVSDWIQVADYSTSDNVLSCTTETCYPNNDVQDSWTSAGIDRGLGFAYYVGDTYELFRRCYLTSDAEVRIAELTNSATNKPIQIVNPLATHSFWTSLYGDLWTARYFIITFGFGISLAISLFYVALMRVPCLLTSVVWSSVLIVIALFGFAGYYAHSLAERWDTEDPPTVTDDVVKYTEITGNVLYGLTALAILLAFCFRGSIQTAISCVQEASKAINRMVLLFGIPVVQGLAMMAFWSVWGYYAAHLASLGDITTRTLQVDLDGTEITMREFEFNDYISYCGWYLLFCFFWTVAFVLAIGEMSVAMAISRWYFTVNKREMNSLSVLSALITTLRYHLGTCAFGALLLAIVRLLRAILIRIQKTVTSLTNKKVASMLLCCCQCCLCCLERILKFINKNAYVQCAIFGTPFMTSGRKAFFLLLRNVGRIGAVSYVGGSVLFLGKLFISILTTALSYYVLVEYPYSTLYDWELELYSYGGPVLLIFCLSYFMASMFMGVFDVSILTILHCFVADEEMFDNDGTHRNGTNGGQRGGRYADDKLRSFVDRHGAGNQ